MTVSAELLDSLWSFHNQPDIAAAQVLVEELTDPPSLEEGQALQLALLQRWMDQGEVLGGWKIGMTSGASRNALGDGIRPFGFILASRIKTAADRLAVSSLARGQVENELCFLINAPLGAGATAQTAMAAATHVLPAFEINQKRLPPNAPAGLRVADNLSNWGIAIGEPVPAPDQLSDIVVTLSGADGEIEQVASPGHIDDHYESLATLARHLDQYGHQLMPGQYVITGAYGKTPFAAGTYQGHFSHGIGTAEITLT